MHVHVILPHADHPTCLRAATDSSSAPALNVCLGTWAARYNTWLFIKLTPKGVVFSFLFFSMPWSKAGIVWHAAAPCPHLSRLEYHSSLWHLCCVGVWPLQPACPAQQHGHTSGQLHLQLTFMLSLLTHLTAGLIRPEASQPFSLHGHTSLHSLHQLAEQS